MALKVSRATYIFRCAVREGDLRASFRSWYRRIPPTKTTGWIIGLLCLPIVFFLATVSILKFIEDTPIVIQHAASEGTKCLLEYRVKKKGGILANENCVVGGVGKGIEEYPKP